MLPVQGCSASVTLVALIFFAVPMLLWSLSPGIDSSASTVADSSLLHALTASALPAQTAQYLERSIEAANTAKNAKSNSPAMAKALSSEVELIADLLGLRPGGSFADIGAGNAQYSAPLVHKVLPGGSAVVSDVRRALPTLRAALAASGLEPYVTVAAASPGHTGLPARPTLDGALLRTSFHHQPTPAATLAQLHAALRPGGRLLVVDSWASGPRNQPGGPHSKQAWAGETTTDCVAGDDGCSLHPLGAGMGIAKEVVLGEVVAAGFRVVHDLDHWPCPWGMDHHYAVLFQKVGPWSGGGGD